MSKQYYVSDDDLKSVADRIREVSGVTGSLVFPAEFISTIPDVPELPQLNAVSISLDSSTLNITNPETNGNFVAGFIIQGNGETLSTTTETSVDLTTIIPSAGEYVITVLAYGTHFQNSVASNEVTYTTSTYTITTTVTNGTSAGSTTIPFKGTATVHLIPNTGYQYPEAITVTVDGATYSYDATTGVVLLSNPTSNVTITAICDAMTYKIAVAVNNGTFTGDTEIQTASTAAVTIVAGSGYKLPDSVTVTNATYTYDSSTGVITLSDPTDNVTVSAECVEKGLEAPTISLSGDTLSIVDNDGNATQFEIYVDGELKTTIDKAS